MAYELKINDSNSIVLKNENEILMITELKSDNEQINLILQKSKEVNAKRDKRTLSLLDMYGYFENKKILLGIGDTGIKSHIGYLTLDDNKILDIRSHCGSEKYKSRFRVGDTVNPNELPEPTIENVTCKKCLKVLEKQSH